MNLRAIGDVGARAREIRLARGLSQSDVARALWGDHTYRPLVGRIERGLHVLRVDTLQRLAAALGCSVRALLGAEPREPSAWWGFPRTLPTVSARAPRGRAAADLRRARLSSGGAA